MSYCLVNTEHGLKIIDHDLIVDGPEARGHEIVIRDILGDEENAIFIARGRESEMKTLRELEESAVKGKGRGRKRQPAKPMYTLHSPNPGKTATVTQDHVEMDDLSEEEENIGMISPRRLRSHSIPLIAPSNISRDSSPSPITPSAAQPSPSAPFDPKWLLDNIRTIVREEVKAIVHKEVNPIKEGLNSIIEYINRKEGRELNQRNCVEKIAQSIVSNETQHDNVEKKIDNLSTMVNTAVKHLPAEPEAFNYNMFGMSETDVSLLDSDLPSFVVLAARLSDKIFPDQITLPFKQRDPARVLWLTKCLIRRRKWSLGNDISRHMTLVRKRIDSNARNVADRLRRGVALVNRQPRHIHRGPGGVFARKKKSMVVPTPNIPAPVQSHSVHSVPQSLNDMSQSSPSHSNSYQPNEMTYATLTPSISTSYQATHSNPSNNMLSYNYQYTHPNTHPFPPPTQPDFIPATYESNPFDPSLVNDPYLFDVGDYNGEFLGGEETDNNINSGLFNDEYIWEEEILDSQYSDSNYQVNRRID